MFIKFFSRFPILSFTYLTVVTILKCHIGKISSRKNYWRIGDEKSMDYGDKNEKV